MSAVLETLTERHVRDAFILATKVFVEHSTLHKALGIRLDEYREYLRPSFEAMVNEGLSVVAISEETNEVVGCLIASDFLHHVSGNEIELGKFGPLSALTNALNRLYASKRQIGEREAVLIDMGAVVQSEIGEGTYQAMRNSAQNVAKNAGFQWVVGELSSAATQHVVLDKLGHLKVAELFFDEFEHQGQRPFKDIASPPSIILAEGSLE